MLHVRAPLLYSDGSQMVASLRRTVGEIHSCTSLPRPSLTGSLVPSPQNHHHAEHHIEHRSSDKEAPQDPLLEDEEEDEDEQDPGEDREIGKDHGHPPSARLQSDGPSRRSHPDDEDSIMVRSAFLHLAVKWWAKHWKAAMVAYLALHLLVAAALDWTRAKAPVLFGMACAAIYAAAVVRRRVISHSAYTSLRVSDQWRVRGRQG
jgi:hypothetical protein